MRRERQKISILALLLQPGAFVGRRGCVSFSEQGSRNGSGGGIYGLVRAESIIWVLVAVSCPLQIFKRRVQASVHLDAISKFRHGYEEMYLSGRRVRHSRRGVIRCLDARTQATR